MTETDYDEPYWVTLVQRLRALSDEYGPNSEVGWLTSLAADLIVADHQIIAQNSR